MKYADFFHRRWIYSRGKGRYVPPRDPLDIVVKQAYPDYMSDSQEDVHLTIRRIMGFELHGHHETWSHSWVAEDAEHRVRGEWLDEVIERICYIRNHPEYVEPWEILK